MISRIFHSRWSALLGALVLSCIVDITATHVTSGEERRPNILFLYLDDFGWKDAGFMGSDFFETPNLDRMAAQGMVFSDAYSCAANCAPARACLMSGQYTPRHHLFNVGTGPRGKSQFRRLLHIPGIDTLPTSISTWPEQLRRVGYRTALIGKWHLSDDPTEYGFDVNVGGTRSGSPPRGYYPPHRFRGTAPPGLSEAPPDEYLTDRLSSEAVRFIRENKDRPWCLYLTHFAVHTPLDAKKELIAKYQNKAPGTLQKNVAMATMIQAVDDGVGRIDQTLAEFGLTDQTVVLFTSDNGGLQAATDMAPLRGYKGTFYEGGIREPFFVRWPDVVAAGTETDVPIIGVDLLPTICEIAGATLPDQRLDGVSLVPLFRQRPNAAQNLRERDLFWHFPAYLQATRAEGSESRDPLFRTRPCSIIRSGHWKLHHYFEDDGIELYDLRNDVGETKNLVHVAADRAADLRRRLDAWRESVGAPIPRMRNPEYDPAAERIAIESAQRESPKANFDP